MKYIPIKKETPIYFPSGWVRWSAIWKEGNCYTELSADSRTLEESQWQRMKAPARLHSQAIFTTKKTSQMWTQSPRPHKKWFKERGKSRLKLKRNENFASRKKIRSIRRWRQRKPPKTSSHVSEGLRFTSSRVSASTLSYVYSREKSCWIKLPFRKKTAEFPWSPSPNSLSWPEFVNLSLPSQT